MLASKVISFHFIESTMKENSIEGEIEKVYSNIGAEI